MFQPWIVCWTTPVLLFLERCRLVAWLCLRSQDPFIFLLERGCVHILEKSPVIRVCGSIFNIFTPTYLVSSPICNVESALSRGHRAFQGAFCNNKVCCVGRLASCRMEAWHQRKTCHLSQAHHWWLAAELAHSQDLQETRQLPLDVMRAIPQVCDQCADYGLNTRRQSENMWNCPKYIKA